MERILLVSATEKSRTMLSQFLTSCGVQAQLAPASSGAEARRMLVDGLFDLVLINTPLPDEFGHDMAQQAANDTLSGVILLAKAEIADSVAEKVEDDGVFVVPKPLSRVLFMQALRMTQRSIREIKPRDSAKAMNSPGGSRPRSGCCQRTRASKPSSRCVWKFHSGW